MTRTDRSVIAALVVLLLVVAASRRRAAPAPTLRRHRAPRRTRRRRAPHRPRTRGHRRHPARSTRSTARTRPTVTSSRCSFAGLVVGPDGTAVARTSPVLGGRRRGATWTFHLRADARWHDGEPVTRRRRGLHDRDAPGPRRTTARAGLMDRVTVEAVDSGRSAFTLETPLGGSSALATQPIVPAHLLAERRRDADGRPPFGASPVGSGPFALVELDATDAVLEPSAGPHPAVRRRSSRGPAGRPARAGPVATRRPDADGTCLPRHRVPLLRRADALARPIRRASSTPPRACPAGRDRASATPGCRADPRTRRATLAAVLLNLRPNDRRVRGTPVRPALLGGDRPGAVIARRLGGAATPGRRPDPAPSWAFDAAASAPRPARPGGRRAPLHGGGLGARRRMAGTTPAPRTAWRSSCSARRGRRTRAATRRRGQSSPTGWRSGFTVEVVALGRRRHGHRAPPPGDFAAAVVDIEHRPGPRPVPAAGLGQARTGGSNIVGRPGSASSTTCSRRPRTGHADAARGGLRGAPEALADGHATSAAGLRRTTSSCRARVAGPAIPGRRPVGPILGCANMAPRCRPVSSSPPAGPTPRWRNRQTR